MDSRHRKPKLLTNETNIWREKIETKILAVIVFGQWGYG